MTVKNDNCAPKCIRPIKVITKYYLYKTIQRTQTPVSSRTRMRRTTKIHKGTYNHGNGTMENRLMQTQRPNNQGDMEKGMQKYNHKLF